MSRKFEITDAKGGAALTVRVTTRAVNTEVAGIDEDEGTLRVRLKASPAGSPEANQELITFLAEKLEISPSHIEIVAGADKREKWISIEGISTAFLEEKFGKYSGDDDDDTD